MHVPSCISLSGTYAMLSVYMYMYLLGMLLISILTNAYQRVQGALIKQDTDFR